MTYTDFAYGACLTIWAIVGALRAIDIVGDWIEGDSRELARPDERPTNGWWQ